MSEQEYPIGMRVLEALWPHSDSDNDLPFPMPTNWGTKSREGMAASIEELTAASDLLAALRLYVKLDNDRRAGCKIRAKDWSECHSAASTAIAKVTDKTEQ